MVGAASAHLGCLLLFRSFVGITATVGSSKSAPLPLLYVRAHFEPPVLVGQSSSTYYHFPAQIMRLRGSGASSGSGSSDSLVMAVSNSFDTAKPCTVNCSRLMQSSDQGRSWAVGLLDPTLQQLGVAAGRLGAGGPCAGPGCVITGPAFLEQPGRLLAFASSARPAAGSAAGNSTWSPDLLVASGSVISTRGSGRLDGGQLPNVSLRHPPPLMAPVFGLAVGQTVPIRATSDNKSAIIMVAHGFDWLPPIGRGVNKTTVYVLRSDDDGRSFNYLSRVPCRATGPMARWCAQNIGGPSEPALTQLADGRLLLLFRTTGTPLMKALSSVTRHATLIRAF